MHRALLSVCLLASACAQPEAKPGAIVFFRVNPATISPGQSAQLTWQAVEAGGCRVSPDVGDVPAEGATLVTPTATTSYRLYCNGAQANALVDVRPAVKVLSFTASPAMTIPDGVVELTWSTEGAQRCTLSPGLGEVVANGSHAVTVTQTTTYTLECEGWLGPAQSKATVTVMPATSLVTPTDVRLAPGDGTLTVTWVQGLGSSNVYLAEAAGIDKANVETLQGGVVLRRARSPFLISGLVNGRTYFVRVSAASGADESDLSTEVSAAPLGRTGLDDPYFAEQWHLVSPRNEDVHVAPAWAEGVKGEGVKVAIVDEGVDLAHEDLAQNVATGLSYDYLGNAPVRLAEHGTCVAGLVAARDLNGKGVRGVAPRAALLSFNVLQDLTSANEYDSMVREKARVSVSNNSWGDVNDGTGLVTPSDAQWLAGVREGATTGRGGKGVLYFWAAGNGGADQYRDRSDYDGQANRRFVYSIAGVGDDGKRASYSEEGANVLVAAPTEGDTGVGLTTTDITGSAGYNTGNSSAEHTNPSYSNSMSGTSGATPVAAGVGALVLQARPELSYRDVRRVLAMSARKNDATDGDWAVNGAGLHVNHKYGFGVVDAAAAVTIARTITPAGPELVFTTPVSAPNAAIPDNDATGASSTITVSGSGIGHIEFVELIPTIPHTRTGDLEIVLSKQGGATDVVHAQHRCIPDDVTGAEVCSTIAEYPFGIVRHLDEPADGDWTLTVRDRWAGNTGRLQSWKLVIYGRQ